MKKKKKIHQEKPEKWDFRDKMIDGYSPHPSLGAYEYVRSLENIENETEKHHFNEKLDFMKKNEEKQEKKYIENGYAYVLKIKSGDKEYVKGVCLSQSLAYDMLDDDYCDSFEEVPIFGSEQDKELLDKLKNQPQFEPFDSEGFTKIIGEQAQKTAQVSHEFNMREIKAKLIADLCKELVKTPMRHTVVPQIAREIAEKALENI